MRLKICMIIVLGNENILTKFRANPMHMVQVHEFARGKIKAIFSTYEAEKLHISNQTLRVS